MSIADAPTTSVRGLWRGPRPKAGQHWRRKRTSEVVEVLAVVNPRGHDVLPYVVIAGTKVTAVRLDRFAKDYARQP